MTWVPSLWPGVGERAQQAVAVRQLTETGQQLANLNSWDCSGDGVEGAANAIGGVWLRVERVELGRPAVLENEDTGSFRPARGGPTGLK